MELVTEELEYGEQIEYTINHHGEKHGQCVTKNRHGQTIAKYLYKNGQLDGPFVEYYAKSGHMKMLGEYKDNKLHGDFTEWFEDGSLLEESKYYEGERHGICTFYVKEGYMTIANPVRYVNGLSYDITADEHF